MAEGTATETIPSSPAAPQAAAVAAAAAVQQNSPGASGVAAGEDTTAVQPARLADVPPQTTAPTASGGHFDILLDAAIPVSVSLGQVTMQVRQLLHLGPGSVVKLERQVGEPVDVLLRGIKFATGHLVVVGDHLGVRIKEIMPHAAG